MKSEANEEEIAFEESGRQEIFFFDEFPFSLENDDRKIFLKKSTRVLCGSLFSASTALRMSGRSVGRYDLFDPHQLDLVRPLHFVQT